MIQIKARYSGEVSTNDEIHLTHRGDLHHYFNLPRENLEQGRGCVAFSQYPWLCVEKKLDYKKLRGAYEAPSTEFDLLG